MTYGRIFLITACTSGNGDQGRLARVGAIPVVPKLVERRSLWAGEGRARGSAPTHNAAEEATVSESIPSISSLSLSKRTPTSPRLSHGGTPVVPAHFGPSVETNLDVVSAFAPHPRPFDKFNILDPCERTTNIDAVQPATFLHTLIDIR